MTLITVNFQFNITNTPTTLPKITVVVPPVGPPVQTSHPVQVSFPGLLLGDMLVSIHLVNNSGSVISSGFSVGAISNDFITLTNNSTMSDIIIASGYVVISRQLETFKSYNGTTDSDGLITIAHGLYYQPTKYLATASEGPSQEHVTMCFVSADSINAVFQVFVSGNPYANSAVSFSAQLE